LAFMMGELTGRNVLMPGRHFDSGGCGRHWCRGRRRCTTGKISLHGNSYLSEIWHNNRAPPLSEHLTMFPHEATQQLTGAGGTFKLKSLNRNVLG
jgi:hypothetical protein